MWIWVLSGPWPSSEHGKTVLVWDEATNGIAPKSLRDLTAARAPVALGQWHWASAAALGECCGLGRKVRLG